MKNQSKLTTDKKIEIILNNPDLPTGELARLIKDSKFFVQTVREVQTDPELQPQYSKKRGANNDRKKSKSKV